MPPISRSTTRSHVKLVSLDCARARIRAIDTSAAEQVDGVRCVLTAAGLPQPVPRFGPTHTDRPVIAVNETRFFGEPVAAVAAETEDAAELAASLVRVDSEELPAVLTIDAALDSRRAAGAGPRNPPRSPLRPHQHSGRMAFRLGRPRRRGKPPA